MKMHMLITILLATSIVLTSAATAGSSNPSSGPSEDGTITELGRWSHGPCSAVALEDEIVLYAEGTYLHVVQLGSLEEVAAMDVSFLIKDIELQGNYAYIAARNEGLLIVDLTTPEAPVIVSTMNFTEDLVAISLAGNFAYLNSSPTLRIVDISDPANPFETGSLEMVDLSFKGPEIDGGLAYIVTYAGLMSIIDVTNPVDPVLISEFDLALYGASDLSVCGTFAYVAISIYGLISVDITDPTAPVIGDQIIPDNIWASTVDVVYDAGADETMAYVGDLRNGAWILDVSNPRNGTVAGFLATDDEVHDLTVVNDNLVLAQNAAGMIIADVSTPAEPVEVGGFGAFANTNSVTVRDNYAYTCDTNGLRIFDTSDPENPTPVGYLPLSGSSMEISVHEDFAYVAAWPGGLHVVDISDPTAPASSGLYYAGESVRALTVSGSCLYMNVEYSTLICDISDPPNLTVLGELYMVMAYEIFVSGDFAYLAASNQGLQVLDISDPMEPSLIGASTEPMLSAKDVVANGTHAYVAESGGLYVYDITDPTSPAMTSFYPTDGPCLEIAILDDRLFLNEYDFGIRLYDLANPGNPAEIDAFEIGNLGADIWAEEENIYLANRATGLWILQSGEESISGIPHGPGKPVTRLNNFPNPFNPRTSILFELTEQSAVTLTILDVRGRVVSRPILNRQYGVGLHTVDIDGARMGSGIYFYRLDTDKGPQVGKMTLLK